MKDSVRAAAVDAGTRFAAAMAKPTLVTAGLMIPEVSPADAMVSASVCTVMPVVLPVVAAPIVKPEIVMVKAVPAAIPATAVVMTTEVAPVAAAAAVIVPTDAVPAALAVALTPAKKNPDG